MAANLQQVAQFLELICPDAVFVLSCVLVSLLPETSPEFLHLAVAFDDEIVAAFLDDWPSVPQTG
jgi:hypothetical protein